MDSSTPCKVQDIKSLRKAKFLSAVVATAASVFTHAEAIWRETFAAVRPDETSHDGMDYTLHRGKEGKREGGQFYKGRRGGRRGGGGREGGGRRGEVYLLTLMTKALRKAAGSLSLYLLVTRQPPITVAALLAKVNCRN